MPSLAIFDIDGTLVDSMQIDTLCFIQSIKDEFKIEKISNDWSNYRDQTDSSIFEEIFEDAFGKKPSQFDIRKHIDKFISLLNENCTGLNKLKEIQGAGIAVEILRKKENWKVSIATGAWRESALFKLSKTSINYKGIPLVTGSEYLTREQIIINSIEQSKKIYGIPQFEKVVYIGDAIWDFQTAIKLKLNFIGIDNNNRFGKYKNILTVEDYTNVDYFIEVLEKLQVSIEGI